MPARQRVGWGRGEWGIDNRVLRVVAILILEGAYGQAAIQAARTGALPKSGSGQGLRLRADALEAAQSFPRISGVGIEQQFGRERDAPAGVIGSTSEVKRLGHESPP